MKPTESYEILVADFSKENKPTMFNKYNLQPS